MLAVSQVEDMLETHYFDGNDADDDAWDSWFEIGSNGPQSEPEFVPELGLVHVLDVEGGTEGSGEYTHIIFRVAYPDGDIVLYKKEGSYASFNGREWDGDLSVCTPVQKVITEYVSV